MRKLFLLIVLFPFLAIAQPTKEEIKKYRIRQVTEKRVSGDDIQTQIWIYGVKGYDSINAYNGEVKKIKNEFKSGKLSRKTYTDSIGKAADIYDYSYKPDGSYLETYTDPVYKMKSFVWYNAKGDIIKSQSPDGNTTTYKYDPKRNLLSVKSDGKNEGIKVEHTYMYEKGKLIKAVKNVNGNITTILYEYDVITGRTSKVTETGSWEGEKYESVYSFEYNDKGLPTKRTLSTKNDSSPGTSVTVYEYSYEYY
jgi:YD repeat-containing protein